MDHAWLDSLSEDWVSQPRSAGSPVLLPSVENFEFDTTNSPRSRPASSRIPKYNSQTAAWAAPDSRNPPLRERSLSDANVSTSQRAPRQSSKLRDIIDGRGRRQSRSMSSSTAQSHNTIQHKTLSLSPSKGKGETPEWKRRLLHGDVAYGEQKDLFAPVGIENIFRPPQPKDETSKKVPIETMAESSIVLASSPPSYNFNTNPWGTKHSAKQEEEKSESRQPRAMKYTLMDSMGSDFSGNDLSRSSSFRPAIAASPRQHVPESTCTDPASDMDSSVVHHSVGPGIPGRSVSGQSDIRNESLSPIYIARPNSADGALHYPRSSVPADELQKRLEVIQEDPFARSVEDSAPESPAAKIIGEFANIDGRDHSQEPSFQIRPLSPSSRQTMDESALLPEESMQASTPKQLPNIKKTRSSSERQGSGAEASLAIPTTPHQSPTKSQPSEQNASSRSPLKLFGTYDTFTNQKLLRRLSQFEGGNESTQAEMNEAFVSLSSPDKAGNANQADQRWRKINNFGEGVLDKFQFSEELSYDSSRSALEDEDKESLTLPTLNPNSQTGFRFVLEPSPALEEDVATLHRAKSTTKSITKKITQIIVRPGSSSSDFRVEDLQTPRKRNGNAEGKRLRKTPAKDSTPKRRRTLLDIDAPMFVIDKDESAQLESLIETHHQMQSIIGKKRIDVPHGNDQQAANPSILAMRQIIRPRTPTPSQRSSVLREATPDPEASLGSSEKARLLQEKKLASIQAELDFMGSQKAPSRGQQMLDESRKGSVTTQDFLDEAKKIMAGIRGKARPRSGLTSLEESESEHDRNLSTDGGTQDEFGDDESYQDSTQEPFSRPPSREGPPLQRAPPKQDDPALLDHLRKYQEMSEMEVAMASMKSLAMARELADVAKEIDRIAEDTIAKRIPSWPITIEDVTASDPPNIRISENPDMQRKRKHSSSSDQAVDTEFPTRSSNASSTQSSSRSIPTSSSRGSESRRVIAPHTVSHLIPEQLAGMVFERDQNRWVKKKVLSGEAHPQNVLPSDSTDDDPFGDIPDLSVDETAEMQRVKAVAARRREDARVAQEQNEKDRLPSAGATSYGGQTDSASSKPDADSDQQPIPAHSELNQTTSNVTVTERTTKTTLWVDDQINKTHTSPDHKGVQYNEKSVHLRAHNDTVEKAFVRESSPLDIDREVSVLDIEREISILEDRAEEKSPRWRRNVTITFSSPLESIIQPSPYKEDDKNDGPADEVINSLGDEDDNENVVISSKRGNKNVTGSMKMRSALRNSSRHMSIHGQEFTARPVSRIDEQDEDSIHTDRHQRSISFIFSAAPTTSRQTSSTILATPRPAHEIGNLSLTPLSEFTVHQVDESLGMDVSYVAHNQRHTIGSTSQKTLSLSIKQLVEKITEVEPYEPFWENIKQIDLRQKRLNNLHKFDEFCSRLERLDVSHNEISHVDGVPATVRDFRITHNHLTDLAAWGHLSNLQYIDVSNNELESLSSFRYHVHLRGLRAENNKITSLDGIGGLDGLLSLQLQGNLLHGIDFDGTHLRRLADLDLQNNKICDVRNLQELVSLSSLNLECNRLQSFSIGGSAAHMSLRHLRLSSNNLESIDVSRYPNLRLLYLDKNKLGKVTGMLKAKYIDSLSLREQQPGSAIDVGFLRQTYEVRKLFLSGNLLNGFSIPHDYLNLQYLELANCGLESLPADFGQRMRNCRVLNLNCNALRDLKPLSGIVRLKRLHLVGNRLDGLRATARALSHLKTVSSVDLRGNPLALGFYPPTVELRMVGRADGESADVVSDPFTLGAADGARDDQYHSCLDMGTKMQRRAYEMLCLTSCPRLRLLDGLEVNRERVRARDGVAEALHNSGAISIRRRRFGQDQEVSERAIPESVASIDTAVEEERWQAEDSFA